MHVGLRSGCSLGFENNFALKNKLYVRLNGFSAKQ